MANVSNSIVQLGSRNIDLTVRFFQRFKSKRSESVVTQRPPEISGSKNTLAATNISRGRNTSVVSGVGPDSNKGANPQ